MTSNYFNLASIEDTSSFVLSREKCIENEYEARIRNIYKILTDSKSRPSPRKHVVLISDGERKEEEEEEEEEGSNPSLFYLQIIERAARKTKGRPARPPSLPFSWESQGLPRWRGRGTTLETVEENRISPRNEQHRKHDSSCNSIPRFYAACTHARIVI